MVKVVDLRCEYRQNPIDMFTPAPRFSWKLQTNMTDVLQQSYEIEVALQPDFTQLVWSSKKVQSGQSQLVPYGGPQAQRGIRHYWRVRVTDNQGQASGWSETAFFENAVIAPKEWNAAFVTGEPENAGETSAGTLLRRRFTVQGGIKRARLYSTAKGIYQPWLNGKRVGEDALTPGWTEYNDRLLYQTYDVTDALQSGENMLGAMVGPGWYKGDLAGWLGLRNVYGKRTAVLARLEIEYENGSKEAIVTDESWKTAASPVLYSEIYHGEKYDARMEQDDWCLAGAKDEGWQPVQIEDTNLAAVCCQDGLPVRAQEVFPVQSIFTTPNGEKVIDFGQNISGWVRLKVNGKAGDRVVYRHAETLDAQGNFYTENLRKAKQTVEYTLKGGGEERYEPHFTFQGFRYICLDEFPGEVTTENVEAVAVYSAMKPTGSFHCSEPLLNQLINNVRWSMKDNFVDIPTDCPQRDERLGWTGDAEIFARAASYLMETAPFFRKWLRDVDASVMPDGGVPHVVPDVLQTISRTDPNIEGDYGATGWGDIATIGPWTMYKYYGDEAILQEGYPMMKKWVEFIRSNSQDGTLWNTGFHFGDWVALDAKEGSYFGATPNDLVATAFYAYSVELLVKAAKVLGQEEDAKEYTALLEGIKQAYADEFFTKNGRLAARTQTGCILSLVFNLTPQKHKERTLNTLVELLAENDNHLTTGFLGTPFLCRALSENGRLDLAYELLLKQDYPSWLYQITKGATTIWEHWDGLKPDGTMWSADMNSFNHYAYGAVTDWIFSTVGGLDTTEESPGYKEFLLEPRPGGGLQFAETNYESGYGTISLHWKIQGAELLVRAVVPANTRARLLLPGDTKHTLLGSGTHEFTRPWQ